MTKPIARDPMYRKRVFDADIIELCVRWYITYRLSYRDLVEMMAERDICGGTYDVASLGNSLRPGVREALESVLQGSRYLVESRRDLHLDQGKVALSLSCC